MGKLRPREGVGSPQFVQITRAENKLKARRDVYSLGHRKEPWPPGLLLLYLSFPPLHPQQALALAPARHVRTASPTLGHSGPHNLSLTPQAP